MNLLYYKAVAGDDKGSYITIYAIESVSARERFWPTGGKEQDIVKQLFEPHKELALELSSYLVEDSYLGPETGAGAHTLKVGNGPTTWFWIRNRYPGMV